MYFLSPLIGYLLGGSLKFIINIIRHKKLDLGFIGMGGMPSTHTTIATAPVALCLLDSGFNSPVIGVGIAFLMITIIDALDLRKKISTHAKVINKLTKKDKHIIKLKENINHQIIEIVGGLLTGLMAAYLTLFIFKNWM